MAAHLRHTYNEPPHFNAHNGKLYIHKKHSIDLGWAPSWQSSKKVEKKWKPLELGIHLGPKFSGACGGTYIQEEDVLLIIGPTKLHEAQQVFAEQRAIYQWRMTPKVHLRVTWNR